MTERSPWLIRWTERARPLRLYCFAYAGGNATCFSQWQEAVDPCIEICAVELPGRGKRFSEAPYKAMPDLVEAIASVVVKQNKQPAAFFGHSLGALLAFEVTHCLRSHYAPLPVHLFVSGCAAPQNRSPPKNLHALPHDELVEELKKYNGTPPGLLENRLLMELVLPTLRADFMLAEKYAYRAAARLELPITVYYGTEDPHVSEQQAREWRKETKGSCNVVLMEGDHFFLNQKRDAILQNLAAELAVRTVRSGVDLLTRVSQKIVSA